MKHACEKISILASEQLERELGWQEKLQMKFHFLMCGACKQYHKNMLKLHKALQLKLQADVSDAVLPGDKRQKIERTIDLHLKKD